MGFGGLVDREGYAENLIIEGGWQNLLNFTFKMFIKYVLGWREHIGKIKKSVEKITSQKKMDMGVNPPSPRRWTMSIFWDVFLFCTFP